MTPKRAAGLVLASLLVAWLASAAGVSRAPADPQPESQPVKTSGTETLASDVQAQAVRLKERLAAAPAPQEPARNPFDFLRTEPPQLRPAGTKGVPPAAAVPTPSIQEPALSLIGIAEDQSPDGPLRAAIITAGSDELFMLKRGEMLGGRYRVATIGPDVVELIDVTTGASRRLALR